jgi:hypothetical protein
MDVLNQPIGIWIAAILTIMVYSYLLGDNPLYRLAEHLLVGSAIAYAVIIAVHGILIPRLFWKLAQGQWLYIIPLILGVLLLMKFKASWGGWGSLSMGVLFGTGAALAVSGALLGTIGPQVGGAIVSLNPADYPDSGWFHLLDGVIIAIGTISTLLYFRFSMKKTDEQDERSQSGFWAHWAKLGRWTIMIAFGAIFAGVVMSRASVFVGRVQFLLGDWLQLINLP